MSSVPTSRRAFVASALALVLAPLGAARASHRASGGCGHGAHRGRRGPHPTPRKGITAARVVPAAQLADEPSEVRAAFEEVRQIPGIADGIRCKCGCAEYTDGYSLLSCYEGDGMARDCQLCQGTARMAFRLHKAGKSLAQIRAAVDERYGG